MKTLIFISLILVSFISFSKTKDGGATSGGGDQIGIDATKITEEVFEAINTIGTKLYSEEQIAIIKKIRTEYKLVLVDEELPVNTGTLVQKGDGFSERNYQHTLIALSRSKWDESKTLLAREVLIHHEIMVLADMETTGDYKSYSLKFENFRKNFWQFTHNDRFLCTISLMEKKTDYRGKFVPGKYIGGGKSYISFVGAKGDMDIIKENYAKGAALIFRSVISSDGYFKMEISEAKYNPGGENRRMPNLETDSDAGFRVDLGKLNILEEMKVYYDPYDFSKKIARPIVVGEKFFITVSCNTF